MKSDQYTIFNAIVWKYYHDHGRHDLPWRLPKPDGSFDPYRILVSEVMLQQTQVQRVIPKFEKFIARFPEASDLADASLAAVLAEWNGLGYNRRAKFLWQAAQKIQNDFEGIFPKSLKDLELLPGVGINTAGAILVYAYNQPVIFIETNIRTVFIHHFFADKVNVPDVAIKQYMTGLLDQIRPREWYWALMDYGTHLKRVVGNTARASKHYTRQSAFQGSRRQIRGAIIRQLLAGPQPQALLASSIPDKRLEEILAELSREGMITGQNDVYGLSS